MIIDIWRPRKKKGIITHYELIKDKVTENKGYKVRYTCDNEKYRNKGKIFTTVSGDLQKAKHSGFENQICRSCISIKSEKNKNVTISYNKFKKLIENEGYSVLTTKKEYDNAVHPSQFKVEVTCNNNHKYYITWNNWRMGKRCRQCYINEMNEKSVSSTQGFLLYRRIVNSKTNIEYNKYKNIINPDELNRGNKEYHLDHKYSVVEGFKNNIPTYIISSYVNLEMLYYKDNTRKNYKCSITKGELFNEYFK